MREIKFRAWDKEHKVLRDVTRIDFLKGTISLCEDTGYFNYTCNMDEVILMQYTGVKDKNEGEVCKGDMYKDEENMLWEVIFDKEDTSYKLENLHTPGRTTIRNIKDMDHVGNIYENPELLGAEQ